MITSDSLLFDLGFASIQFEGKSTAWPFHKNAFPTHQLKRIKQVHGTRLVHTSAHTIDFSAEADGQYTSETGLALGISTADCLPVFMVCENPRWVMALHAGWRGVASGIVRLGWQQLLRNGCSPHEITVFIGPHIQKNSFEVDELTLSQLSRSVLDDAFRFWEPLPNNKFLVSLGALVVHQLESLHCESDKLYLSTIDTKTNDAFHSFRRDKESSGRQVSWGILKDGGSRRN